MADAQQVQAFATATFDHFGTAHVVCNNAGVGGGFGRTWEVTPEGWEWTVSVNLMGVVHGIQAFVPRLVEQGEGHVVNTASLAGLRGAPMMGPYVATKHAVVGLSESLHHDLVMSGSAVGVSVLCPSFIRTRIADSGRNWPARLGVNPMPEGDSPGVDFIRSMVESGMDPADYAATVVDAVRTDRFIVLSDPTDVGAIAARHDETRRRRSSRWAHVLSGPRATRRRGPRRDRPRSHPASRRSRPGCSHRRCTRTAWCDPVRRACTRTRRGGPPRRRR